MIFSSYFIPWLKLTAQRHDRAHPYPWEKKGRGLFQKTCAANQAKRQDPEVQAGEQAGSLRRDQYQKWELLNPKPREPPRSGEIVSVGRGPSQLAGSSFTRVAGFWKRLRSMSKHQRDQRGESSESECLCRAPQTPFSGGEEGNVSRYFVLRVEEVPLPSTGSGMGIQVSRACSFSHQGELRVWRVAARRLHVDPNNFRVGDRQDGVVL